MAEIRQNRAKAKLRAGKPVLAPNLGHNATPDLDALEQLASLGLLDMAWVEMEHGPWTWDHLSDISRVCDLWGIASAARVDLNEPAIIGRVLDRGIQGVLVPHVNTRAEAERAIEGAYYPPLGGRGIGSVRQGYGVTDFLKKANDQVFVMVLLEEVAALKNNINDILAVPGIDVFFVGPGDLS